MENKEENLLDSRHEDLYRIDDDLQRVWGSRNTSTRTSRLGIPHVCGIGTLCLDYIAFVDKYPTPDSKVRSNDCTIGGGGNIGNTLTAISRLGVCKASVATQVGSDGNGKYILDELQRERIITTGVFQNPNISTPFTYILVDSSEATRTCIHTPMTKEITAEDLMTSLLKIGEEPSLLHLDSRQTEAALHLVKKLRSLPMRGSTVIPTITIDCEKNRPPHMNSLIDHCDIVFSNEHFPLTFKSLSEGADEGEVVGLDGLDLDLNKIRGILRGMAAIIDKFKHVSIVVTSLGANGAVLLCRESIKEAKCRQVKDFYLVREAGVKEFSALYCYPYPLGKGPGLGKVVDTTGAGDAFIGGFISTYLDTKGALGPALVTGTLTAASKITKPGARAGLPHGEEALVELRKKFDAYYS